MATKKEIKDSLQAISEQYYREELETAGFSSYKNEGLDWYRINGQMVNHIALTAWELSFPQLFLVYGVHPFFLRTKCPFGPILRDISFREDTAVEHSPKSRKWGPYGNTKDLPNQLALPQDLHRKGAEELAFFLERFAELNTPQKKYEHDRIASVKRAGNLKVPPINWFTNHFIDEIIFFEDIELYPLAERCIAAWLNSPNINYIQKEKTVEDQRALEMGDSVEHTRDHLKRQLRAICENERKSFLDLLAQRAELNLTSLKKKVPGLRSSQSDEQ